MDSKQTNENTKHTNIRLPSDMYAEVEKMAEASQRTISGQIRFIIQEYLKIKKG